MKKVSWVLIIIGLLIAGYPFMDRAYTVYMQKKVLRTMDENITVPVIDQDISESEDYMALQDIFDDTAKTASPQVESSPATLPAEIEPSPAPSLTQTPAQAPEVKTDKPIGVLIIDKINLKFPIMDGATMQNMKIGAARIKETSKIGEVGNVALAGHRSYTYGYFFNRLDELEKGDEIIINAEDKTFKYTVYEKKIVEPTDVSVLNRNKKDRVLTLVTCHPIHNSTHRLIIHAIQK
jgi:sortase A